MSNSILVVEDNALLLEVLADYLTYVGYRVCRAQNVDEALAQLSTNPIDLVLSDAQLAGLYSLDFFLTMHRNYHVPIIVVTGTHRDEVHGWSGKAGIREVLVKPVDLDHLSARIESALVHAN